MIANVLIQLVAALAAVEAQGIDVALNKKIFYCTVKELPVTVTDGKKQIVRPSIDPEECPPTPKLEIKLGNLYFVNYVVFYTGRVDPSKFPETIPILRFLLILFDDLRRHDCLIFFLLD